jgi:hypothetical protein
VCFEAAPATWALPWGCGTTMLVTENLAIGTGKENTAAVVDGCAAAEDQKVMFAAKFADQLRAGGKDDWFLPSQDELKELYAQRKIFADCGDAECAPDLAASTYWSSSHGDANEAFAINFVAGEDPVSSAQKTIHFVRPVRSFK